ncbi:hypothetical protein B0H17DRAFT_1146665 [Mycena rosella]|uniref:DUF6532 domain-containing protein n=1 Tax=Mycena rosella TaxID=1033263 RepID=A0AAD7CNL3_MYCRO|nr:hypothetical protein B0H17DRAFT_1146665 [Mycena rosella]
MADFSQQAFQTNQFPAANARRPVRQTEGGTTYAADRERNTAIAAKKQATIQKKKQQAVGSPQQPPPFGTPRQTGVNLQPPPSSRPQPQTPRAPLGNGPPAADRTPLPQGTLPRLDLVAAHYQRTPITPAPALRHPLLERVNNSGRQQYPDFTQSKGPLPQPHTPQPPAESFQPQQQVPLYLEGPQQQTDQQYVDNFFSNLSPDEQQKLWSTLTGGDALNMPTQAISDPMQHPGMYEMSIQDKNLDDNEDGHLGGGGYVDEGADERNGGPEVGGDGLDGLHGSGSSDDAGGGRGLDEEDEYEEDPWADKPEEDGFCDVKMRTVEPAYAARLAKCRERESEASLGATSNSAPSDSGSSSGEPSAKKRKQQASRSIKSIDIDLQRICELAYEYLKTFMTHVMPWPRISRTKAKGPGAANDQFEILLLKAWISACIEMGLGGEVTPDDDCLRIIRSHVPQFRSGLKALATMKVALAYGLKYIATLTDLSPENIAKTVAENRARVQHLKQTFHFLDPNDPTAPNTMCRNKIFQELLCAYWFGEGTHNRASYLKGRTQVEWETVAFIGSAVIAGINQYETVQEPLRDWEAFSAKATIEHGTRNLALELKEAMLRDARAAAAIQDESDGKQEDEAEQGFFSRAMFMANQIPVVSPAPADATSSGLVA